MYEREAYTTVTLLYVSGLHDVIFSGLHDVIVGCWLRVWSFDHDVFWASMAAALALTTVDVLHVVPSSVAWLLQAKGTTNNTESVPHWYAYHCSTVIYLAR